jgi:hypothetical protein
MPSQILSNSLSSHEPFSKLDRWSLAFDGSDEYVTCGSDSSLDVGTSEFTIAAWVKVTVDQHCTFVSKGDNFSSANYNNHGWALGRLATNDKLYFDIHAGTDGGSPEDIRLTCASSDTISLNQWTHVAATRTTSGNDSIYSIYINAVLKDEETAADGGERDALDAAGTITDASNNFDIGRSSAEGSMYFGGRISDVAYYNTGLSLSQIQTIYDGGDSYRYNTGVASANLQGWWRMGDGAENGTGTTIYDASSNSNNGTMTNMEAADFKEDSP